MLDKKRKNKKILIYKNNAGVNLVELMISLSIMAILTAMAAPSFEVWMSNMKVKSNTENVFSGISEARAEAIKINAPVYFKIENTGSWTITNTLNNSTVLLNKQKGTGNFVTVTTTPSESNIITFNGFGRVIKNKNDSETITDILIESTSAKSNVYSSKINLNSGGVVSYCSENPNSPNTCS